MTTRSPLTVWAWLTASAVTAVVVGGILGGLLMPALFLDLLSFWPLWLLIAVASVALLFGKRFSDRLTVVPPLVFIAGLLLVVLAHFGGWAPLPSSAGDLVGPDPGGLRNADLALEVAGTLRVEAGDALLYVIELDRRGGPTGVPEALETINDEEAAISVREDTTSSWFLSSGWQLRLSPLPAWNLALTGAEITADFSNTILEGAAIQGDGEIHLPAPVGTTEIVVDGDLLVSVPRGTPTQVFGDAVVPDGWPETDTGWRAPIGGPGYLITVAGGSLEVIER